MIEDFFTSSLGTRIFITLLGVAILTLGRKLFWLATAVAGFILGLGFTTQFFTQFPDWVVLIIAIGVGIVAAFLAVVVQKVAVGLVGLILGGYTLTALVGIFGLNLGEWGWIVFIIGAIIGVILALSLLEVALIILSALAGAVLIVQAFNFTPLISGIIFVVLLAIGITIQAKMLPEEA